MNEIDSNIIHGGESTDFEQTLGNLGDFILIKLNEFNDEIAMINGATGQEITYIELKKITVAVAESLKSFGIKKGDVIGIFCENNIYFPIISIACIYLGVTIAPFNHTYLEDELEHAVRLSKPKIIFTTPNGVDISINVSKRNDFLKTVVVLLDDKAKFSDAISLNDFIGKFKTKQNLSFKSTKVDAKNDVGLILCSSGTTGLPKGVELTYYNMLISIGLIVERSVEVDLPDKVLLSVLPWSHVFGFFTTLGAICTKSKLVFLSKFENKQFLGSIQKYRVSVLFMVPPLMTFLAKHPLVDEYDLSSIFFVLCGAAPLSKEIKDAVQERLGIPIIHQAYGMSETLNSMSQSLEFTKSGSVGAVTKGMSAKVIDPETGKSLGKNQPGELCLKGMHVMKGYIGDENATKNTIDKYGWLHTGDIAYYDEDHEFFIVDRIKELIKYKAFQVPPAEIEAVLLSHPYIKDAAVIGKPDEHSGELPMAFVVKGQDNLTEEDVINFVSENVSSAKRLRGGVRFIKEIPKNTTGKILRRELRDLIKISIKSKL